MKIIGLTGPSGSGKTTVSEAAKELGFFVVDCDEIARQVSKDTEVLKSLEKTFGEVLINGKLDRKALAKKAFSSPENTKKLNDIMLPIISARIKEIIKGQKQNILLDAPTLFESGLDSECDAVLAVLAREDIRRKRLKFRDNLTEEQLESRIKAAKPDEFYTEKTGYIIYNNDDIDLAKKKAEKILRSF